MREYITPEIEIISLTRESIVATSGYDPDNDQTEIIGHF